MAETPTRSGPTLLTAANTSQTIVTAGALNTWIIVRFILLTNVTTATVKVTAGIGTTNTDSAGKRIANSLDVAQGQTIDLVSGGFLPLLGHGTTPDLIYALCDTANGATVTLGQITGP